MMEPDHENEIAWKLCYQKAREIFELKAKNESLTAQLAEANRVLSAAQDLVRDSGWIIDLDKLLFDYFKAYPAAKKENQ